MFLKNEFQASYINQVNMELNFILFVYIYRNFSINFKIYALRRFASEADTGRNVLGWFIEETGTTGERASYVYSVRIGRN